MQQLKWWQRCTPKVWLVCFLSQDFVSGTKKLSIQSKLLDWQYFWRMGMISVHLIIKTFLACILIAKMCLKRYGRRHNPCPKDIYYLKPITGVSNMTEKQIKKRFLQRFKSLSHGGDQDVMCILFHHFWFLIQSWLAKAKNVQLN